MAYPGKKAKGHRTAEGIVRLILKHYYMWERPDQEDLEKKATAFREKRINVFESIGLQKKSGFYQDT